MILLFVFSGSSMDLRADSKVMSTKQARQAMARIAGLKLKTGDIRVKQITATATGAEMVADVRTVFKFETDKSGQWYVAEIRTGQDKWERIDLIARVLHTKLESNCTAPDPPVRGDVAIDPSAKRSRCLLGALLGIDVPSDAVRIQEVDPMPVPFATQPSATVVAWITINARLINAGGWQVSELRTGQHDWVQVAHLVAALDAEKGRRAREEMQVIARGLERFRNERGFFVVSDSEAVAIDHLSPRYLSRVIRLDPWNQPYEYAGERDRFTLRSRGPDGKTNTADDVVLTGP